MKPGLRTEWMGRKNVLLTHPRSRDVPCVLFRNIDVPDDKKSTLALRVNNHPMGNWKLIVRIDGKSVLAKSIEDSKWQEFRVDLTEYAGNAITAELENCATGWSFEAAYWSQIEIQSE